MTESGGQQLQPGALISRYEVREVLGAGGFGITYKAFDTRLHCEVAIKEYLPGEFAIRESNQTTVRPRNQEIAEQYQQGIVRFLDEARVLAKFKNRHIVRVSDYMELNGTAYLVMDYEEGESLRELMKKRGGSLSETEIKALFIPILDGLKAVHEAGLLHRDIKPDNIYLRNDGPPVLLDFGAARTYTANQTRDVTAIVTPGYAPFEQYQPNGRLGAWTDLYAIGATVYHCISGKAPLDALSRIGSSIDPLPPAVEVGGDRYSWVLLQTVDWMLQRQPEERPQTVDEVIPCVQGRAEPPMSQTVVPPSPSSQAVAATVRIPAADESDPGGEATILRPAGDPAEEQRPTEASANGRRMTVLIGAVLATIIAAGGIWWYIDDQSSKQIAREQQETERVALAEAERQTQLEAEKKATEQAQMEADSKAQEEAAGLAQLEAEKKAAEEAARVAQAEAEAARLAQAEAEKQAQEEAARLAQAEADRKTAEEAVQLAKLEAEKQAAEEAARIAQTEASAARLAQAEAEKKAQEQAARAARAEAEKKAQDEAARLAQAEAEKKAQDEAARLAQAEAEMKAREETARLAQAEAERMAEEEAALVALLAGEQIPSDESTNKSAERVQDESRTLTGNVDEFLSALLIEGEQTEDEPESVASAGQATGQPTQSTMTAAEIDRLLQQAEFLLSKSSLVSPKDRNALVIYREVLAADPINPIALAGMINIGAVYEKAATNMLGEGRPDISSGIVERGLEAVPGHPGLMALKVRLDSQTQ